MRYFDKLLQQQSYYAGDKFSMADIAVIGGMIFASLVKLPVPEECEALRAWYARMQERPSYKTWRALVDQGAPKS